MNSVMCTRSRFSVLLYAFETWTIKKDDERMLLAYEMRCYRNMLGVGRQEERQTKASEKVCTEKRQL